MFHCPAETYPFISSKVDTMVTCSVAGFISVTDSTDFTNMNCLSKGFYCCSSEKQRDNRNVTAGATTVRDTIFVADWQHVYRVNWPYGRTNFKNGWNCRQH